MLACIITNSDTTTDNTYYYANYIVGISFVIFSTKVLQKELKYFTITI